MSGSSDLYSFRDGRQVAIQLVSRGVLSPGLVQYCSQHSCVVAVIATHLEERYRYYLTYGWGDKGVNIFTKGLSPKVMSQSRTLVTTSHKDCFIIF